MRDYFGDRQNDEVVERKLEAFPFWKFCMHSIDKDNNRCKMRKVWSKEKNEFVCPNPKHARALTIFDIKSYEVQCMTCFLITNISSGKCVNCEAVIEYV